MPNESVRAGIGCCWPCPVKAMVRGIAGRNEPLLTQHITLSGGSHGTGHRCNTAMDVQGLMMLVVWLVILPLTVYLSTLGALWSS